MIATHLIILIHGLYGDIHNLHAVRSELLALAEPSQRGGSNSANIGEDYRSQEENARMETVVYLPKSIGGARTWDGVDVCAHRVAEEIDLEIDRLSDEGKDVTAFSVMGYSLGGLIARYLIGLLNSRQQSFFSRIKPVSFSTAATPHLGVLKYATRTNTIVHSVGRRLFSQTGRQLYCADHEPEWEGRSLLEVMSDPDRAFINALRLFPKVMLVANGTQDLTVPYPTAAISSCDPFADPSLIDLDLDDNHIIRSYCAAASPQRHLSGPIHATDTFDQQVVDEESSQLKATTKTGKSANELRAGRKMRPPLPPVFFLPLPFPFNYTLFLLTPLVMPIALVYLLFMVVLHTFQSRKRIRSHRMEYDRQPLLISSSTPSFSSSSISSVSTPVSSTPVSFALRMPDPTPSSLQDGTCTPPMAELPPNGTGAVLLLTAQQKLMVKHLNEAIPHAKRVVAWFPWAYNSHAMLICRAVARFPWQEDGRGVVRTWARFVFEAGENERHALLG